MAVRVQREDFDVGAELAALTRGRTDIGALTTFVGLVRDMAGDAKIDMSAYPSTQAWLKRIEGLPGWISRVQ